MANLHHMKNTFWKIFVKNICRCGLKDTDLVISCPSYFTIPFICTSLCPSFLFSFFVCVLFFVFSFLYQSTLVNCVIDGFLMSTALAKHNASFSLLSLLFFCFLCYLFNKFGRHLQDHLVAYSSPKFQNKPKEIMAAARKFSLKNRRILSWWKLSH